MFTKSTQKGMERERGGRKRWEAGRGRRGAEKERKKVCSAVLHIDERMG